MFNNIDELVKELNEKKSIKFRVNVSANSKTNMIDICEKMVRIKVSAPAKEGKANKAIIEYLSDVIGIAKSKIKIVSGEKSSIKTIFIKL